MKKIYGVVEVTNINGNDSFYLCMLYESESKANATADCYNDSNIINENGKKIYIVVPYFVCQ